MNISIVIPCYNEEDNIDEIFSRLIKTVDKTDLNIDKIIFVDDGSFDQTWNKIISLKKKNSNIIMGIKFSRNFGHQYAVLAGLKFSKSDLTLIIDSDLQDPPEILEIMYDEMTKEKANCVYAQRKSRKDGLVKKVLIFLFYRILTKVSAIEIPQDVGDFRLIDKKICQNLIKFSEKDPFIRGLVPWTGFKQIPIKFDRDERKKGKSGYNFGKLLKLSLDGIFSFSSIPLRIPYYIFILSSFLLIITILYTLNMQFNNESISFWNPLIIIILFFNSMHFFFFFILAEYMGRSYKENLNRPKYIISDILDE